MRLPEILAEAMCARAYNIFYSDQATQRRTVSNKHGPLLRPIDLAVGHWSRRISLMAS